MKKLLLLRQPSLPQTLYPFSGLSQPWSHPVIGVYTACLPTAVCKKVVSGRKLRQQIHIASSTWHVCVKTMKLLFAIKSNMMQCHYSVGKRNNSQEATAQSCKLEAWSQAFLGAFSLSSTKSPIRVPQLSPATPNESGSEVPMDGNVQHVLMSLLKNKVVFQLLVTIANVCLVIVVTNPS